MGAGAVIAPSARADLALGSRPESLAVVQALLGGFAEAVRIDRSVFDDLRAAVSEACTNVIQHAYGAETGPMWVELALTGSALTVTVLDRGAGIRSSLDAGERMGLDLIELLASEVAVYRREGGGTEVRMRFDGIGSLRDAGERGGSRAVTGSASLLGGDVVLELEPVTLLPGVLGRVCAAIGAGAGHPVDRRADLELVADELSGLLAGGPAPPSIGVGARAGPGGLSLRLGPLELGTWDRLCAARPAARELALERLCDGFAVISVDGLELIDVRLGRRRPRVRPPAR